MAGAGVRIEVEFDDRDVRRALRRLIAAGQEIDRPGGVLDVIGARLVASVQHRFETETGPGGVPWKPSVRAREEGGQTLTDTGRLRASITHRLGPGEVVIGTNVVYAAIHQFGGQTPPRVIRPKHKKALAFTGGGGQKVVRKSVRHPGSKMPARPFLGIDTGDEAVISETILNRLRRAVRG